MATVIVPRSYAIDIVHTFPVRKPSSSLTQERLEFACMCKRIEASQATLTFVVIFQLRSAPWSLANPLCMSPLRTCSSRRCRQMSAPYVTRRKSACPRELVICRIEPLTMSCGQTKCGTGVWVRVVTGSMLESWCSHISANLQPKTE